MPARVLASSSTAYARPRDVISVYVSPGGRDTQTTSFVAVAPYRGRKLRPLGSACDTPALGKARLDGHIASAADSGDDQTAVRRCSQDLEDDRITLRSDCPEVRL